MQRQILGETELTQALENLNGWTVEDKFLKKHLKFENFAAALEYVNKIGAIAETADHHPDITFGWGYARLELTTHDRSGITDVDIALATKIDQIG